eukprot:401130-Rhodomonas_salina.1
MPVLQRSVRLPLRLRLRVSSRSRLSPPSDVTVRVTLPRSVEGFSIVLPNNLRRLETVARANWLSSFGFRKFESDSQISAKFRRPFRRS